MKRIAIFCDGTWQSSDSTHPSNVARLADALLGIAPDGVVQRGIYVAGVGTAAGRRGLSGRIDRLTGGALGWGLDANIEAAYRALIGAYAAGDEVFVFGYSRGAYTARSLIGLIRRAGVMLPAHVGEVPEAMRLYRARRDPTTDPDHERMMALRADRAPATATSVRELDWRRATGRPVPDRLLQLAYLGVWETVGALGVPGHLTVAPLFNHKYQFHNTDLSSLIGRARHAVAIDERRLSFVPTLWSNLADLNRDALGLPPGGDPALVPIEVLPYRQEWFPGDHGSVGGGNASVGLSSYACEWIAEGAARAGLAFDEAKIERVRRARRIADPLLSTRPARIFRLGDREGPDDPRTVSAAARERLAAFADYAPATLARVLRALRPGA